ncbi:MAG: UDP-glucose/GDP-mannose dehydrogenase family protein [Thermoprotei archaeon]
MKISFFGLGYVGLSTALALASKNFRVYGYDVDENKIKMLKNSKLYIYEPGLKELFKKAKENFIPVTDPKEAVLNSDITFITVGTPSKSDGSIDLSYIESASRLIGKMLKEKNSYHLIVVKSTVVPGTTENVIIRIIKEESGKIVGSEFGICVNPEFLKEGSAVEDTFNPDRIVIGCFDEKSGDVLESLWRIFYDEKMPPLIRTNLVNAEFIKYSNNAFLAMKVSFINEIANIAQKIPGADVEVIAKGIGLDKRIGPLFLKAGLGFGGSCFPKDLRALINFTKNLGYEPRLLESIIDVNNDQPYKAIELSKDLIGDFHGKKIAILGLSFKPNTDDMREAVSIKIINKFLELGANVTVYDPAAIDNARHIFGNRIIYAPSLTDCIKDADCAIIVTEWNEFKHLKPEDFIKNMKQPIVIDGRRIYDPKLFSQKLTFSAIGLGK